MCRPHAWEWSLSNQSSYWGRIFHCVERHNANRMLLHGLGGQDHSMHSNQCGHSDVTREKLTSKGTTPPSLPKEKARADASAPHCPGNRQMVALKSGSRGGIPDFATAQQPGVWRWPRASPCAPGDPWPPATCPPHCQIRTTGTSGSVAKVGAGTAALAVRVAMRARRPTAAGHLCTPAPDQDHRHIRKCCQTRRPPSSRASRRIRARMLRPGNEHLRCVPFMGQATWTWSSTPSPFRSAWRPGEGRCSLHSVRPLYRCTASMPSSRCATSTFGAAAAAPRCGATPPRAACSATCMPCFLLFLAVSGKCCLSPSGSGFKVLGLDPSYDTTLHVWEIFDVCHCSAAAGAQHHLGERLEHSIFPINKVQWE